MIDQERLDRLTDQFAVPDIKALPENLCRSAADLIGVSDVTLAFIGVNSRVTLCASSSEAMSLDNWQFTLDEGPCLDAARTGSSFSADLLVSDTSPWPQFEAKAREAGFRAIGGVPLRGGGQSFGAMNLQSRIEPIDEETMNDAVQVAQALSEHIVARMSESLEPEVDRAGYATVHQATGMVSVQLGVSIADALALLRAHAWTNDQQLIDVGREVISGSLVFPREAPAG